MPPGATPVDCAGADSPAPLRTADADCMRQAHCASRLSRLDKLSTQYLWVVPNPGATRPDGGSIRVLIADDHPVYLDGLAAAIERTGDLELLGTCANGAEALERIRAESPDVAVLDLRMPRLGAAEVLAGARGGGERRAGCSFSRSTSAGRRCTSA